MPQLEQISTFPSQIFWLVITFAALFFVMWRIAVPRIADVLEARQKRIDDNLDKAETAKKEAEAAIEAYEQSRVVAALAYMLDHIKQKRDRALTDALAASDPSERVEALQTQADELKEPHAKELRYKKPIRENGRRLPSYENVRAFALAIAIARAGVRADTAAGA